MDSGDRDLNFDASDQDSDRFTITVVADLTPAFASGETILAQTYMQNAAITPLTLPEVATAGNGATTYTLSPPAGLTFDPATRVLSGTPQAEAAAAGYTYTAADTDGNTADTVSLTFQITVDEEDVPPAFAVTSIPARTYVANSPITPLTLPVATGGNGPGAITYTLTPPAGLNFDPATRVLSGTPTTAAVATMFTYTAADGDTNTMSTDSAILMLSITVEADTVPAFAVTSIPAQTYYTQGAAIAPLTLPVAAGGNGAITYTLSPLASLPNGLTFDGAASPPTLTGNPTATLDGDDVHLHGGRLGRQHHARRQRHADVQHHSDSASGDDASDHWPDQRHDECHYGTHWRRRRGRDQNDHRGEHRARHRARQFHAGGDP